MSIRILIGDMRVRLREISDGSLDSCVTDPPYHLASIVKRFGAAGAAPVKAGATGAYVRASRGFMGQTWDGGDVAFDPETWAEVFRVLKPGAHVVAFSGTRTYHRMACAIEDAGFEIRDQLAWIYGSGFPKSHNLDGEHEGWGSALKPSWEPICFGRKPLIGTIAGNMALHGVGAINIDGCRIEGAPGRPGNSSDSDVVASRSLGAKRSLGASYAAKLDCGEITGRWPANIIHDGSDEVVNSFPIAPGIRRADEGSAARFFYSAKASKADRGDDNPHPTVKPVDLMRWLVRLITPKGGTVLDPFMGSGSTLIAADVEQMDAIGIELSPEYAAVAERRIRAGSSLLAEVRVA